MATTQITARAVTKSYGDRVVLDDVTCSLPVGQRTGVIGENGSGKTTLLRLLAHDEQPDQGDIVVTADGGIGYLPQNTVLPPRRSVQDLIDDALHELRRVENRLHQLEAAMATGDDPALTEYGQLMTVFELRGGYDADARVDRAMHGLGLAHVTRDRALGSLSGGQQARLRLAAVLAAAPEVLLLDEPTNHLDPDALGWLEDHLRTRRGTTVAVSHDRVFLDRVMTSLIEVDGDRRTLTTHPTGYAGYLAEKAAARQRWIQAHQQWQDDVTRLRDVVATTARRVAPNRAMTDRNKMAYDRAGGRVQQSLASRVRNADERLRRALADPVPAPPPPLHFTPSLTGNGQRGIVLAADEVALTGRLARTSLTIDTGSRLLITGANAAGKTTLLRVLAGDLPADHGTVTRRGRLGYLPQEVRFRTPHDTVLTTFARARTGTPKEHAERLLALGLLAREHLDIPVGSLSTGQARRLALARLVTEPLDALLLDEPTNHLSPALAEELEAALENYTGAVLVVSHDRRLHQRWHGDHRVLHPPHRTRESR